MRKKTLAAALLGATMAALFAAPAQAASTGIAFVTHDKDGGSTVRFKAGSGKANRIVVTNGPTYYITIDDSSPIQAGRGCKAIKGDRTKVNCGVGELTERVEVATYDRNDSITNRTRMKLIAHGGTGNDTITGSSFADVLYGNDGADRIYGNGGSDYVSGGNGNDTLYGGAGNDRLIGGNGTDKLYGGAGHNTLS